MKIKSILYISFIILLLLPACGEKKEDFRERLNYYNSKYRFRITFPESWLNYATFEMNEIIDPELKIKTLYFALPTRSRDWQPVNLPSGYAALFSIRIFTTEQWILFINKYGEQKNELNNADKKIGEDKNTVYMLKYSTSIPVDLYLYMKEVKGVAETFRLIISE